MQPNLFRANEAEEYWFEEGCFITEVANGPEDEEISIARARVPCGVTTAWHKLKGISERYLIVSGSGVVEIGAGVKEVVNSGDVVLIPEGMWQRIINTGVEDLIFYAICTPRFTRQCYIQSRKGECDAQGSEKTS